MFMLLKSKIGNQIEAAEESVTATTKTTITISPNSITPTFTETSPRGKSQTQNGDKS